MQNIGINSEHKLDVKVHQQGCLGQLLSDHSSFNKISSHKGGIYGGASIQKLFVSKTQTMH